jgi:membrane-bound lytic murein transglycosylase D
MLNRFKNRISFFLIKSQKSLVAVICFLLLFVVVKLFNYSSTNSSNNGKDYINSHFKTFSLNIPKDLSFAGEKVPLTDYAIIESLDRELLINTYWQSQTLLLFKRANRWFPVIEPILKKNNIPDDFKYLAVVESGLTNIVSPAKATGYWQILEETGKNYGLAINENVDERYSMEKSTEAACRYFKEAYQKFNNWTLVAASYNLGIGGISGQLEKQKVQNYYDLYLIDETTRYVFRVLAVKDILSRPEAYGFVIRKKDLYPTIPVKKLQIDSSISDLTNFAISQGINYKILKLLNPWLRGSSLDNPDKKTFSIQLPKKGVNILEWEEFSEKDTTLIKNNTELNSESSAVSDTTKITGKTDGL